MKYNLFLILLFFVLSSCKKDKNEIEINRDVESFSNTNFKRYNADLYAEDFILNTDGSLVVVGNGKDENSIIRQPFILTLDLQKEISWLAFLNVDQRSAYRRVNVIPTQDEEYMVLSYSDPENSSKFNIDLTKVNLLGNVDWNKRINEEDKSLKSSSIVQLPNEDYIILSEIEEDNSFLFNQMLLNRVSANGDLIWSKIIEETAVFASRQIILFPDNASFIALSEHNLGGLEQGEIRIHKFDFDGNIIWQKSVLAQGKLWPLSSNISKIEDENFMVMFSSDTPESIDNHDVFLIKMDQDGNSEWEKSYPGLETDVPENLIPTNDGKYVLLTNTSSFGNGEFDVMLTKLDIDGEILWDKVYGSISSDQARNIVERNNGNLVIIGNTNDSNNSNLNFDFFLLETDENGNPE